VEHEVNHTLSLLSDVKRARPDSGFYDRVLSRMNREDPEKRYTESPLTALVLWPRFSYLAAALLILIVLNSFSIFYYLSDAQTVDDTVSFNAYVEQYMTSAPGLYDYEELEDKLDE